MLTQAGLTVRDCAYTEVLAQTGGFAYRNQRYKYMDPTVGQPRFFDLQEDPWEMNNLMTGGLNAEQQAAFDQLSQGCELNLHVNESSRPRLALWPNPTNGSMNVANGATAPLPFTLLRADGALILAGLLPPGNSTLDFVDVPPGLYLIQAAGTNQRLVLQ